MDLRSPLRLRLVGNVLRQRTVEVTEFGEPLERLVAPMAAVMRAAGGVGVAGPQVGLAKRLFVYDLRGDQEECLSVPGLSWMVFRPERVLVAGQDIDGEKVEMELDGLAGRLFQHEVDHLDGVLLLDRLADEERRAAKRQVAQMLTAR